MPSRTAGPVRLTALVLLLAGCDLVGSTSGGDDGTGGGVGAGGGDPGERPTAIDPGLRECGTGDDELQLADVDLTRASWDLPAGFVESTAFHEDNPVESLHSAWYAVPTALPDPALNVVQVVVYTGLDWGEDADECGRVPLSAVEERLALYREEIGADPLSEAEMTTVAGQPAITQDIGLSRYSYEGYWLFSPTQLLHVYCQWTAPTTRETVLAGCAPLVQSVRLG